MFLEYNESSGDYEVQYTEHDKCKYCSLFVKCPLISALQRGEYCISHYANIPTEEFCTAFEPDERLKALEKSLKKNKKAKDK